MLYIWIPCVWWIRWKGIGRMVTEQVALFPARIAVLEIVVLVLAGLGEQYI